MQNTAIYSAISYYIIEIPIISKTQYLHKFEIDYFYRQVHSSKKKKNKVCFFVCLFFLHYVRKTKQKRQSIIHKDEYIHTDQQ